MEKSCGCGGLGLEATEATMAIGAVAGAAAAAPRTGWQALVPTAESRATLRRCTSLMISENNRDAKSRNANA